MPEGTNDGAGGNAGGGANGGAGGNAGGDGASGAGTGAGTGGDTWKPPESQAALDRIVQDRLARERAKFGDYDEAKAKAAKFDELEAASASDLEKATKRAEAAEAKATAATERAVSALRTSAVRDHASKLGAVDADAVLALIPKDAVTVGDDGQVAGAEEAVKALLSAKPYLVGTPTGGTPGSADGGARGNGSTSTVPQLTRQQIQSMTPREIEQARKDGKLADLLAGRPTT